MKKEPWELPRDDFNAWFDAHVKRESAKYERLERLRVRRQIRCFVSAIVVVLFIGWASLPLIAEGVGGYRELERRKQLERESE